MKTFLVLTLTVFSLSAYADHHEEGKFEDVKAKMLSNMDKRIAHLQEAKSCISAAKDKEGMKACREKMKAHKKEMKAEFDKMRSEHKAKKDKKKK